ncbi:hypothetical protein VNI00_011276 [Paramarasmius palmivorus]|uniref:Uncharacterized protein n=1 Tax=Paramarasmius palmivorus TaxID=297713 RepID=A0AAW0CBS4_9AGAR
MTRAMQRSTSPPVTTSSSRPLMSTRESFPTLRNCLSPPLQTEATNLPKANTSFQFQLDDTPDYVSRGFHYEPTQHQRQTRSLSEVIDDELESEFEDTQWLDEEQWREISEEKMIADTTMKWEEERTKYAMIEEKEEVLALKKELANAKGRLAEENAKILGLEQIIEVLSGNNDLLKIEIDDLKLSLQESWKENVKLRASAGAQKKEPSDAER